MKNRKKIKKIKSINRIFDIFVSNQIQIEVFRILPHRKRL